MDDLINSHLKDLTVENLMKIRSDLLKSFTPIASSYGKDGDFHIGVNGTGHFVVKGNGWETICFEPETAIKKYTKLISES